MRNKFRVFLSGLLLLTFILAGCVQLTHAIQATPQRFTDAWEDPVRREHILYQSAHLTSTGIVTVACSAFLAPTIVGILVCPVVGLVYNYLTYEYLLEPWAKARVKDGKPSNFGPYWERGPQDGERFINE